MLVQAAPSALCEHGCTSVIIILGGFRTRLLPGLVFRWDSAQRPGLKRRNGCVATHSLAASTVVLLITVHQT
jgi:hypothetical protein